MTDFANHPASLTEIKSDRTGDAADWTPRDVLIFMLREIDSGREKPEHLMIIRAQEQDDRPGVLVPKMSASTPNGALMVGIVTVALHRYMDQAAQ